ncbi:hypothetical protein ACP4OV_012231 [Aristida adscensionis]
MGSPISDGNAHMLFCLKLRVKNIMASCKSSTIVVAGGLLLLLTLAELAHGGAAAAPAALYVLGDSQADVGNNNYLPAALLKANFPHNGIDYPGHRATGRFSNGKNFVDFLADGLQLASPPAYHSICNTTGSYSIYLNGVNFASGGAGVSDLTNKGQCFSFDDQIECDYLNVYSKLVEQLGRPEAMAHLADSIFAVAIGGNDIINRALLPVDKLTCSPEQFIDSLAQTLKRQLQRLYELGMRRLFFVGTAPLGCVPLLRQLSLLTNDCHAGANAMSVQYNRAVASLLRDMSAQHGDFHYAFFDTSAALLDYIREPQANGYAEVAAACCFLGVKRVMLTCNPLSVYCANRTSHMFWDVVHPTEITSRKLSTVAFDGSAPLVSPINVRRLSAL